MSVSDFASLPETAFWQAWQGSFQGMLNWHDFDALLQVLRQSGGTWYVWDLAGAVPEAAVAPAGMAAALDTVREMNAPMRARSYCGTIYVDDPAAPAFVKAFDPHQMGATCGSSGERIMPRFVFSRLRPDPLPEPSAEVPVRFWGRWRGRG